MPKVLRPDETLFIDGSACRAHSFSPHSGSAFAADVGPCTVFVILSQCIVHECYEQGITYIIQGGETEYYVA